MVSQMNAGERIVGRFTAHLQRRYPNASSDTVFNKQVDVLGLHKAITTYCANYCSSKISSTGIVRDTYEVLNTIYYVPLVKAEN